MLSKTTSGTHHDEKPKYCSRIRGGAIRFNWYTHSMISSRPMRILSSTAILAGSCKLLESDISEPRPPGSTNSHKKGLWWRLSRNTGKVFHFQLCQRSEAWNGPPYSRYWHAVSYQRSAGRPVGVGYSLHIMPKCDNGIQLGGHHKTTSLESREYGGGRSGGLVNGCEIIAHT